MLGITKEQQLKQNKIKKEPLFGKKSYNWNNKGIQRITTDDELEYLNWLKSQQLQCIVCGSYAVELHHLKLNDSDNIHSSSVAKDHTKIIPICTKHHTGKECSFHGNKKELAKLFTKEALLIIANRLYNEFLENGKNIYDDIEYDYSEY